MIDFLICDQWNGACCSTQSLRKLSLVAPIFTLFRHLVIVSIPSVVYRKTHHHIQ